MTGHGLIRSVRTTTAGSYLAADAAVSDTALVVESVLDFASDGGQLALGGVTYTYTAADYDTDTLTLSTGLTAAALATDRVDVFPVSVEKVAVVTTINPGDAVSARIPHALVDRIPEGIRAPGDEESVQYTIDNGDFIITDVVGRSPVVDGSYIAPSTVPPGTVVVQHGADGTVARPAAAVVYWIGAATPVNGLPYDFWYTATI